MKITKKHIDMLNQLLEPIGEKPRIFAIDYRDDYGNFYNEEHCTISGGYSDSAIADIIIRDIEAKGYTVYSIYEILNGYCNADIERLAITNPADVMRNVKFIYMDMKKERPVSV